MSASKSGWWIRVCDSQSANGIFFEFGKEEGARICTDTWTRGKPNEFDVPEAVRGNNVIWVQATVTAETKFCLLYRNKCVQEFRFDDQEDHKRDKTDSDECSC